MDNFLLRDSKCVIKDFEYARAYIKPQKYEELFSLTDAMKSGTIFMALYSPYYEKDEVKYCEKR